MQLLSAVSTAALYTIQQILRHVHHSEMSCKLLARGTNPARPLGNKAGKTLSVITSQRVNYDMYGRLVTGTRPY